MIDTTYKIHFLIDKRKFKEAEKLIKEYISKDFDSYLWYEMLWRCFLNSWNFKKAKKAIEKSLEIEPNNAYSLHILGVIFFNESNFKKAKKYFLESLEKDPFFVGSINFISELYIKDKKYKLALKEVDRWLAIDPNDESLLKTKSLVLFNLWREDEAKTIMQDLIWYNPEWDSLFWELWNLEMKSMNFNKASELFIEWLRINPHCETSKQWLLEIYKLSNPLYKASFYLWEKIPSLFDSRVNYFFILIFWNQALRLLSKNNLDILYYLFLIPFCVYVFLKFFWSWIIFFVNFLINTDDLPFLVLSKEFNYLTFNSISLPWIIFYSLFLTILFKMPMLLVFWFCTALWVKTFQIKVFKYWVKNKKKNYLKFYSVILTLSSILSLIFVNLNYSNINDDIILYYLWIFTIFYAWFFWLSQILNLKK